MKSFYSKIKVSFFLYILIFISLISGLFRDVLAFLIIIVVHEIGHIITSKMFNWKIKCVHFYICGGFIEYDNKIDKPFKEEFLVSISGILFQSIFFLLCTILNKYGIIDNSNLLIIKKYHLSILIFNLIPIIPLDGSKIVNVFFNMFLPYKKSLYLTFLLSMLCFLLFIYIIFFKNYPLNVSIIMVLSFILNKLYSYLFDIPYLYNTFLLERFLNKKRYKKNSYIKSMDLKMLKRQRNNYFYNGKNYVSEFIILAKRFDLLRYL